MLLLVTHCVAGPRSFPVDMSAFSAAALALWFLAPRVLPAPPARRSARGPLALLAAFTLAGVAAMVIYAVSQGAAAPDPGFVARTLAIYVPYAAVQQYLTQRYLVVRARSWLGAPGDVRVALGIALLFGLLHLPFPDLIAPTVLAGFVWTFAYLRSGRLWPLALSHALLAVGLFALVLQRDPFRAIFG